MVAIERKNGQTQFPDGPVTYTHILTLAPRTEAKEITEAYAVVVPLVTPSQNILMIVGQPVGRDQINKEKLVERVDGKNLTVAGKFPIRNRHGDIVALDDDTHEEHWMSTIIRNAHRQNLSVYFVRVDQKASPKNIPDERIGTLPQSPPPDKRNKKRMNLHIFKYNGAPVCDKTPKQRQKIYENKRLSPEEIKLLEHLFAHEKFREISLNTGIPHGSLNYKIQKILEKFD